MKYHGQYEWLQHLRCLGHFVPAILELQLQLMVKVLEEVGPSEEDLFETG